MGLAVYEIFKASVTIVAGFCREFHPPFLWGSKHQTKMTVHINNLVPSEFPNRSSRSVGSLISTLICIQESRGIIMKLKQLSTEFEYFTPK